MLGTGPKNLTDIADGEGSSEVPAMDTASIIGLIVWFCCVLYSSVRSTTNDSAARIELETNLRKV